LGKAGIMAEPAGSRYRPAIARQFIDYCRPRAACQRVRSFFQHFFAATVGVNRGERRERRGSLYVALWPLRFE
jgi:hypothetical protein